MAKKKNRKKANKNTLKSFKKAFRLLIESKALKLALQKNNLLIAFIFVVLGVSFLGYQYSVSDLVTKTSKSGGNYVEGVAGEIDSLNPLYATTQSEKSVSRLIFSRLMDYDKTGTLRYDVAKKINVSDDEMTYVVDLRNDVYFHDGEKMTADDVVFTVDVMRDPQTRAVLYSGWRGVQVEKMDDYKVKFTLPSRYSAFEQALTFAILPEHVLRDVNLSSMRESVFSISPVGSGAFKIRLLQTLEDENQNKVVHLDKNDNYYRGAVLLDKFELRSFKTQSKLYEALEKGELTAGSDVEMNIENSKYQTIENTQSSAVFMFYNMQNQYLKDVEVRKAIAKVIDLEKVRSYAGGEVKEMKYPIFERHLDVNNLNSSLKYDLESAGKILDKEGWKLVDGVRQKDGHQMSLTIKTIASETYEGVANSIAEDIRKLGVIVKIEMVDIADPNSNFTQDVLQSRNYDILIHQLVLGADPDVYAYWHSSQASTSGLNFSNYQNGVSDVALESALDRYQEGVRRAKYTTFVNQWLSDVPAVGLYNSNLRYLVSKKANSVEVGDYYNTSSDRYYNIIDWSVKNRNVYKTQ